VKKFRTAEEIEAELAVTNKRWASFTPRKRAQLVAEIQVTEERNAERQQRMKDREMGLLPPIDGELDEPTD
jgi:hypothetical protein